MTLKEQFDRISEEFFLPMWLINFIAWLDTGSELVREVP